ncbi:MAG: hypothetical protein P8Y69_04025, partial [Gammaproteobacteria bacterium]
MPELESATPRHRARLRQNTPLTDTSAVDEIRELVFEVDDPDFRFEPGQSIAVIVPGPHDLGHAEH